MKKLLACLAYLLSLVKVSAQSSACVAVAGSLLCLTTEALAQSVQQSGTVTPGHAAMWTANGVIKDAGTAANGFLTSLGVTNNGGPGVCVNSGPITGPYNAMCLNTSSTTDVSCSTLPPESSRPKQAVTAARCFTAGAVNRTVP